MVKIPRHNDLYYEGDGSYASISQGYLYGTILFLIGIIGIALSNNISTKMITIIPLFMGAFLIGVTYSMKTIGIKFEDKRFPAKNKKDYY